MTAAGRGAAILAICSVPAGPAGMMSALVSATAALIAFAGLALAAEPAAPDGDIDRVFQALGAAGSGTLVAQAEAPAPPVSGQLQIEPADEDPPPADAVPIKFYDKLDVDDAALKGKSIEELIVGTPLFPPIEGLDPSIWQKKNCGTCHQWTKERLCVQAKTYVGAEHMVARLEHPYGLAFKQALERWAEGGCQ
jgi:hypothetical protein